MPVFPGMVTSSGDLVILAVQRQGEDLGPTARSTLAEGDTLLVQGTLGCARGQLSDDRDVLVVDSPDMVRRQAVPLGPGAGGPSRCCVGMVVLLATGIVPPAVAGLLAACAMVLLRRASPSSRPTARSPGQTVVLVGGMIPLSHARSRAAGPPTRSPQVLVDVGRRRRPVPAAARRCSLLTAVLGQLISNTATALIVMPIALSAAAAIGVSPAEPMLMAVNVASPRRCSPRSPRRAT